MALNLRNPADGSFRAGDLSTDHIAAEAIADLTRLVGIGAKNGSTVSVKEAVFGPFHYTELTLVSTPVEIVSVTTGNGVGGTKVYDFPQCHLNVLSTAANLSISVAAAKQADFTDATPEGDIGIGTVAPANADALGTDATDDDFATAAAFTMSSYTDASVVCPPDATAVKFDGTSTAKDMYVNVLVDAADIDDDATTEVLVSGTIKFVWINGSDY